MPAADFMIRVWVGRFGSGVGRIGAAPQPPPPPPARPLHSPDYATAHSTLQPTVTITQVQQQ